MAKSLLKICNDTIAKILYTVGIKYSCSTFIDEDTITAGYGKLDSLGDWQYPLSEKGIKKEFGANMWSETRLLK